MSADNANAADKLLRRLSTAPVVNEEHNVEWGYREAQTLATLALVDQQHIANMQVERDVLRSQAAGRTDSEARRLGEQADVLEQQIREGLGL